jgi:hypothetical protein
MRTFAAELFRTIAISLLIDRLNGLALKKLDEIGRAK